MSSIPSSRQVLARCSECPLSLNKHFREFDEKELSFMVSFKTGELSVEPGTAILVEGAQSANLYTVLSGWAFRYKILEDGRRQILNFVLPGDLVGLQGALMGEMQHSVEALTPLVACVFERHRMGELWEKHSSLAHDLTWIAAREERILDEHLLSVGRRSALERAAYLLAFLFRRAAKLHPHSKNRKLPFTQAHVADTLGLSLVHTNKTLRKLSNAGLIRWRGSSCEVLDVDGLCDLAGWTENLSDSRPYI